MSINGIGGKPVRGMASCPCICPRLPLDYRRHATLSRDNKKANIPVSIRNIGLCKFLQDIDVVGPPGLEPGTNGL